MYFFVFIVPLSEKVVALRTQKANFLRRKNVATRKKSELV